jgi:predicted metalloprotease with PDZ domain
MKIRLKARLPATTSLVLLFCAANMVAGQGVAQSASASSNQMQQVRAEVDLRDAPRHIFHSKLTFAVKPGPLTLLYPQWIPGEHGPTGPISQMAGLKFTAGGKTLAWRRDDVNMFAFHLEVPAGATELTASLDYLSPGEGGEFSASPAATAKLAVLEWCLVTLYPQGVRSDGISYSASLQVPPGWKYATALPAEQEAAGVIQFQPVSLSTLIDSPVLTGEFLRKVPLGEADGATHTLDLASDVPGAIEMTSEELQHFKNLVTEAKALFGAHHYRHYDFLLTLSDHVSSFGLEHHESSDDRADERALSDPDLYNKFADLLPHEFVHSWNGKYRRPSGLATPDFDQPMKDDLLWVYEGLTQYLGAVLAARSGLRDADMQREYIAWVAGYLDHWPGRTWAPLQDTAVFAQYLYNVRGGQWSSWRRSTDFYDESLLIWLEADTIIRRESKGQRTLDDFCHIFHGPPNGAPAVKPYTFEDVVAALNQVVPFDWRGFLRTRLDATGEHAPLGGIENAGWHLSYTDKLNGYQRSVEAADKLTDVRFSLGLILQHKEGDKKDGLVLDVIPGSPASAAGISPDMKLIAVNGRDWSPDLLREAIATAKGNSQTVELLVENTGVFETFKLNYHEGERYPHLAREATGADLLTPILSPHASGK